uniref:GATOR2 complex protein WDR24 n=1 Tax=Globodera rostochiensis TaxID=31243 RepID=A0A914HVD6_GLORO
MSPIVAETYEALESLSTNRDRSRVAVIGRTVAKVYAVHENRLELRTERSKPRTAMYFSGSIAWSPLKENLVAAASSNGCIFLWDPQSSHSIERAYKAHKQLATKVCFNEFNENLMVSGSKDSTVWLYDLRSPEPSTCFASNCDDSIRDIQFCMESKLQDTFVTAGDSGTIRFWDARRPDRALKEFIAHSSQVYSVALNPQPQSKNLIATAGRDKYIRIWDWSKNTPHFIYTVETMAIVTRVSWCPDNSWHVACCFAPPSGFVYSDNIVYVWDIRRPFIPFASFDAHSKTCTDMSWSRFGSGDRFFSCGKDGKLIINFADNAQHPILYANSVALDANSPFDDIAVAVPSDLRKSSSIADPFRRKVPSTLFCAMPSDPFLMTARTTAYFAENYKMIGGTVEELCEHNAKAAERIFRDRLAYTWRMVALLCTQTELGAIRPKFSSAAKTSMQSVGGGSGGTSNHFHHRFRRSLSSNYLLGKDHQEISHHRYNYKNRILHGSGHSADDRTAGLPKLDKDFPSTAAIPAAMRVSGSLSVAAQQHGECDAFGALDLFFGADELNLGGIIDFGFGDQQLEKGAMNCISRRSIISSSIVDLSQLREEAFAMHSHGTSANRRRKLASDGTMTVETFCVRQKQINRKRRTPRRQKSSPFFGCDALNSKSTEGSFDLDKNDVRDENDRGDVEGMASNSSGNGSFASSIPPFSPSSAFESDGSHGNKVKLGEDEETEDESECSNEDEQLSECDLLEQISSSSPNALQKCNSGALLFFDPIPSLRALFDHYSSMGDIQMSATLCMIMGERVVESGLVSAAQAELWLLGYLELLERLRLWRVAALLVKCCFRPKINQLSIESTFMKVWCTSCRNTALSRASPRCKSCQRLHNYNCCICETRVRGLWTTCNGCGHGGHLEHLREWFAQWEQCPVPGCGHLVKRQMASLVDRFLMKWNGIPMLFGAATCGTFYALNNRWFRGQYVGGKFGSIDMKTAEQLFQERRRKELMMHLEAASYVGSVALSIIATGAILRSLPKKFWFSSSVGIVVSGIGFRIGALVVGALLVDGPMYAYTEWLQKRTEGRQEHRQEMLTMAQPNHQ